MFRAMIFLQTGWGSAEGNTKEDALSNLKKMMPEVKYSLTFRPLDGTIYHDGNHIPCGVVFEVK
jgi:hypothetical protein